MVERETSSQKMEAEKLELESWLDFRDLGEFVNGSQECSVFVCKSPD